VDDTQRDCGHAEIITGPEQKSIIMEKNFYRPVSFHLPESEKTSYSRLVSNSASSVDSDSNWLISLNDVLSLLLVFFIMFLFMTKNTKGQENIHQDKAQSFVLPDKGLERGTDIIGVGEEVKSEINSEISSLDLGDQMSVYTTNKEVVITMKEKIAFTPGESEVLPGSEQILDNIAGIIGRHPHFLVEIIGHTDNVPIKTLHYPSNWELSVARAASVLKYFINNHVDPSRLSIKGYADQKPIAANNTADNRAKNRRVEIRLKIRES
jgi:chemotaxis protein MotB